MSALTLTNSTSYIAQYVIHRGGLALARLPGLGPRSARRAVLWLVKHRESALPALLEALAGVAETLDWVRALHRLSFKTLPDDPHALLATLGCLLKTREDRFVMGSDRLRQLVEGRRSVGVAEKTPDLHQVSS